MDKIFYLIFWGVVALILFFLVFQLLFQALKLLIWRELKENQKSFSGTEIYWLSFNATCLVVLAMGFLVSWFWFRSLSFGFLSLLSVPLVFRGVSFQVKNFQKRKLEMAALTFFYGLLGLIQSGRGFNSALFDLTQNQSTSFTLLLRKYLENYQEGKGFSAVLSQFRKKTELPLIGTYLATLEMAYTQGLAVSPLLEQMIPSMEVEQHYQKKIEDLRRQSMAQALLAFFVPWILSAVLWFFNPELFVSLKNQGSFIWVGGLAVGLEILGVWVLWQITKFY